MAAHDHGPRRGRRALPPMIGFALLAALAVAPPAAAQDGGLPAGVGAAIEEAVRASESAAANAAFSAAIADSAMRTEIASRTETRVAQSSIAESVVAGIARYPQAVSAIVAAAVRRAPAHRDAVVRRASFAFPIFAPQIAAAAGMAPPVLAAMPEPYWVPAPSYAAAPAVTVAQAAAPTPSPARADTAASRWPRIGISELRFGIDHHDTGVFGNSKEGDVDIALGVRFLPLTGDIWEYLGNPRPFLGLNINTSGDTSALDFGVNWDWEVWRQTYFSWAMGGAAHDGKNATTDLDRKELGSRVLFYLAAEVGYRFDALHSLSVRLDHMSHASLADNNEGLDTVGLVYGYHF